MPPFLREVARKCRRVLSFTPHHPLGTLSCLGFTPRSRSIAYELRSAGFIRSLSGLTSFRPSVNPPQGARGLMFIPLAKEAGIVDTSSRAATRDRIIGKSNKYSIPHMPSPDTTCHPLPKGEEIREFFTSHFIRLIVLTFLIKLL